MTEKPKDKYVICVVALEATSPRQYKNYYLGVEGTEEEVSRMRDNIAGRGFKTEGRRIFPDAIETVTIKDLNDTGEEE